MPDGASGQPLVIGCGISGLIASRGLTRRGIDHVLVGGPPSTAPQLGESLDLAASILFPMWFPSLAEHFHPKRAVRSHLFDYCVEAPANLGLVTHLMLRLLGMKGRNELIHLDRHGFDRAAYDLVRASPRCTHLETTVEEIEYDAASDRVRRVTLGDGRSLEPSFVVDAAGPRRLLGRRLEIPFRKLGGPQRVVFGHCDFRGAPSDAGWRTATTLLRLRRDADGIDAALWCIPFRHYLSIGVTAGEETARETSDERLLALARSALQEAGGPDGEEYTGLRQTLARRFHYGHHERALGANWLLAGPSYGSFWFATSTGLALSLGAAEAAASLIRGTEGAAEAFRTLVAEVHLSHERMNFFMYPGHPPTDSAGTMERMAHLIRANFVRAAVHSQIRGQNFVTRWFSALIQQQVRDKQLGTMEMYALSTDRPPRPAPLPGIAAAITA